MQHFSLKNLIFEKGLIAGVHKPLQDLQHSSADKFFPAVYNIARTEQN